MLDKVLAAINRYKMLVYGERILVGVSGGPDSVTLLHVLKQISSSWDLKLHIAHLNHKFRGKDAEADARFVSSLAQNWGIEFSVEEYDVPALIKATGMSPQQAAHEARFSFLERVAGATGATKIALGHNQDDQAETFLIHLLRGGGTDGLGGMKPCRGKLIRPLIDISREEIEIYIREHNLKTIVDQSNFKNVYVRNRVRMELLPLLQTFNPAIKNNLAQTADLIRAESVILERSVDEIVKNIISEPENGKIRLSIPLLISEPVGLQRRVIRRVYAMLTGTARGLTFTHVEQFLRLLGLETGSCLHLPSNVVAAKSYDSVELSFDQAVEPIPDYEYLLQVPGRTSIPELDLEIWAEVRTGKDVAEASVDASDDASAGFGAWEARLDLQRLSWPVYIRKRRDGDRFRPFGGRGMKKLKEILIDRKIPRSQRERIPLLASGKDIYWVPGIGVADGFHVGAGTEQVLRIRVKAREI